MKTPVLDKLRKYVQIIENKPIEMDESFERLILAVNLLLLDSSDKINKLSI
jgi:hypothetical protein